MAVEGQELINGIGSAIDNLRKQRESSRKVHKDIITETEELTEDVLPEVDEE